MFQRVKFLFNFFVFQHVLSIKFKKGDFHDIRTLALIHLLSPFVTYFGGDFIFALANSHETLATITPESKISPFVRVIMEFSFLMPPFITGVVGLLLCINRKLIRKLLTHCFDIEKCLISNTNFEDAVRSCLHLYLILQFLFYLFS